jgi:hypothetical protein
MFLDHDDVMFDSDDAGVDLELGEQVTDRDGAGDLERLAIQSYRQSLLQPWPHGGDGELVEDALQQAISIRNHVLRKGYQRRRP